MTNQKLSQKVFKRGKYYYFYNEVNKRESTRIRNKRKAVDYTKSVYRLDEFSWDDFESTILNYIQNNGYSNKSIELYERVFKVMRDVFQKNPLELTPLDFEHYKGVRRQLISSTTLNIELSKIQSAFNMLFELKITPSKLHIKKVIQPKPMPTSIKDDEMEAILNIAPPVIKEFIIFAVNTGLRLRELTNLTYDSVEGDYIVVKTTANFRTKCDKYRRVPLNDKAKEVLFVVLTTTINAGYLSYTFRQICDKLGLSKDYHFHTLRKTFATKCARSGMLIYDLMKIMGHADLKTLQLYYEVDLTNAIEFLKKI